MATTKTKPAKPSPDFPLFAHAAGQWAKKIDGRIRYFGRWDDPEGALQAYQRHDATKPVPIRQSITLADACNRFLTAKDSLIKSGELSPKTFAEYKSTFKVMLQHLGRETPIESITPTDWTKYRAERSKIRGLVALGNEVIRIKSLANWLKKEQLVREPLQFGADFKKPSAKALRKHRRESGKKLLSRPQIRAILDECGVHLKAMVMLAINAGFGNTDCARLPLTAVDFKAGWIDFPRPKTEVDRKVPLWPETVKALKASRRRRPKTNEKNFFVLHNGKPFDASDHIGKRFRMILSHAGINRGGFYWLRHTFETIAGESKDQVAVNALMGHVDGTMSAVYREEISEERLLAVTETVRSWLFATT